MEGEQYKEKARTKHEEIKALGEQQKVNKLHFFCFFVVQLLIERETHTKNQTFLPIVFFHGSISLGSEKKKGL